MTEDLEKRIIIEKADTENNIIFSGLALAALIAGAAFAYTGHTSGSEFVEGVGYGVIGMDVFMNIAYRGLKYLKKRDLIKKETQ